MQHMPALPSDDFKRLVLATEGALFDSFEAFLKPGVFRDLVDVTKSNLTAISSFFDSRQMEDGFDVSQFTKEQKKFIAVMKGIPYPSVTDLKAYVPEGMKVPYLDYLKVLSMGAEFSSGLMDKVLIPYEQFLGTVLGDHRAVMGSSTGEKALKSSVEQRKKINEAYAKCFQKNSHQAVSNLGLVIRRHADWAEIFSELSSISEKLNRVNHVTLQTKINHCTAIVNEIVKAFSDEDTKVSKEAAAKLGQMTIMVAQEVEFYSTNYFRLMTMRGSVKNTMEFLMGLFDS